MIAIFAAALAAALLASCGGGDDHQEAGQAVQLAKPTRVCVSDNPLHIHCQEARQ